MKYIKTFELNVNNKNISQYGDRVYSYQSRERYGDRDIFILGKVITSPTGLKIDGYIVNDLVPENNGKHITKQLVQMEYNLFTPSQEEIEQYEFYENTNKYNL